MEGPEKYPTKGLAEGVKALCPVCGRELEGFSGGEWQCACGESIPKALAIDPMTGFNQGRGCGVRRKEGR